jgi:integrase
VPLNKLTTTKIAALIRDRRAGLHGDGGNLYLQITVGKNDSVASSWIFRYQRLGQTRDMGLGSFADVTLAEARVLAASYRKIARGGGDPIAAREADRARKRLEAVRTITFEAATTAYLDAHRSSWGNYAHRRQWEASLKAYALPVIGAVSVRDIDMTLVLKVIEPLWLTKTETANRVRRRIEKILDWARVRGYRSADNPARWKGHLDQLLPARRKVRKIVHHAALPYGDIPAFMTALRAQPSIAARALEFAILSVPRTGDLIGNKKNNKPPMRWSHVQNLDHAGSAIWVIPSVKGDREHRVPLSPPAVDLLLAVKAQNLDPDIVFPERPGKSLHHGAMLKVLDAMGEPYAGLTVHGFRAAFKSWGGDMTGFAREVIEACLSHTISDELEAAYRRTDFFDKRRRLMNAWAGYCVSAPTDAKVLPIRK